MNTMMRLVWMVAAVVSFSGAANAYSAEAIADAETLLKSTTGAQDRSVVRYHLLELRLAAGKLSPESFCRQARAELQVMAAAEGDEPVKAGIAGRSDKIEAMTASQDLCRQAVAEVDDFLFGADKPAKTNDDVKESERRALEARKRYKGGDLDRTSATLAEVAALEAPYTAGRITRDAYCGSGQAAMLADLAGWAQTLAQHGQIGLLGQISVKRQLYKFKALCPGK